jgi:hypothetical protein
MAFQDSVAPPMKRSVNSDVTFWWEAERPLWSGGQTEADACSEYRSQVCAQDGRFSIYLAKVRNRLRTTAPLL